MDKKVPVSQRALIQRINRKLRPNHEQVQTARGGRALQNLARYYRINVWRNVVIQSDLDLEGFARELEAMAEWEKLSVE